MDFSSVRFVCKELLLFAYLYCSKAFCAHLIRVVHTAYDLNRVENMSQSL